MNKDQFKSKEKQAKRLYHRCWCIRAITLFYLSSNNPFNHFNWIEVFKEQRIIHLSNDKTILLTVSSLRFVEF